MAVTNGDMNECEVIARSFLQVVDQICPPDGDASVLVTGLMYPYLVNLAFSCELYLKAIYAIGSSDGSSFEKGHSLKKLFAALPLTSQSLLKQEFAKLENNIDFNSLLAICDTAFVDWRYAFSKTPNRTPVTALRNLANALQLTINSLRQ